MPDSGIVCAGITGICTIIVACISLYTQKQTKRSEKRAMLRREESLLSLRMMDATLQLSIVSANALTDGHNNGNVERARKAAQKVNQEYIDFMQRTTAGEVSK